MFFLYCCLLFLSKGIWSEWYKFTNCSDECGNGTFTEKRHCLNKTLACPPGIENRTQMCSLNDCVRKYFVLVTIWRKRVFKLFKNETKAD